jgi:hypothetical protein
MTRILENPPEIEIEPVVKFLQLVPGSRPPQRADRTVGGTISVRALRYCEAITTASSYGWYVFLPLSFKLLWDGHDVFWTYDQVDGWLPLESAQYPNFCNLFDETVPTDLRGYSPPFLTKTIRDGGVQIWTGCIAETKPGWHLLIRPVANLAKSQAYQMFEGIIQTDAWFGPLFNNIRLIKTNVPISFRTDLPFLQIQPVKKEFCSDKFLGDFQVVNSISEVPNSDWQKYFDTIVSPRTAHSKPGQYAVKVRKGRVQN